jgi:hypothetical protein
MYKINSEYNSNKFFKHQEVVLSDPIIINNKDEKLKISHKATEVIGSDVLSYIEYCVETAHNKITIKSSLPKHEENAWYVEKARKNIEENIIEKLYSMNIYTISEKQNYFFKLLIKEIENQNAGNCEEFSVYVHHFLKNKNINSEIFHIVGGDHVFLVVDRDSKTEPLRPKNWNENAYIIDPFRRKVFMASEIDQLESCLYNKEDNKISYHSFKQNNQCLNNGKIELIVNEYQQKLNCKCLSQTI